MGNVAFLVTWDTFTPESWVSLNEAMPAQEGLDQKAQKEQMSPLLQDRQMSYGDQSNPCPTTGNTKGFLSEEPAFPPLQWLTHHAHSGS